MLHLRPHHGVCIRFFQGKGYDPAFVQNMQEVIRQLEAQDPMICLTNFCDVLCRSCPYRQGTICQSAGKVAALDAAVLSICGIREGTALRWSEFSALVREMLLEPGFQPEVCSDCQWYPICKETPVLR